MRNLQQTTVPSSKIKTIIKEPNFGNDYNAYYHCTGVLPQKHVTNRDDPYEGYPKLQQLRDMKRAHLDKYVGPVCGQQCEPAQIPKLLQEWVSCHVQFDVLMVGGCSVEFNMSQLLKLPLDKLAPRPSVLLLWVPPWKLDEGREVLEKWGFRRSEDITFVVKGEDSSFWIPDSPFTANMIFRPTTWHCYMGLKGTLRRSDDAHLINCNVDTDVILEGDNCRPNIVPEQIYDLVERFSLMGRRVHITPFHSPAHLPVRLRRGWVFVTPDTLLENVELDEFTSRTLVPVDPIINQMRPQTPPRR